MSNSLFQNDPNPNKLSMATGRLWLGDHDPGIDEQYVDQGNFFLNTNTKNLFFCMDGTPGALVWYAVPLTPPNSPVIDVSNGLNPAVAAKQVAVNDSVVEKPSLIKRLFNF